MQMKASFAKVNPIEFRRSFEFNQQLSEAFKDKSGMVLIRITSDKKKNKIQVIIQDNGCGIPENIISRLGKSWRSVSAKENTDSGSGLGIYHAKKTIESFGGLMKIQSMKAKEQRSL